MPDLNIRHFRLAAAAVLAAAMSLTALVAVAPAASATTLGTKSIILEKLSQTVAGGPTPAPRISGLVVDTSAQRAYVINQDLNAVDVYEISGGAYTFTTRISSGLSFPFSLDVDQSTHQVLVAQKASSSVALIDGAPGSPSRDTVVATISTGSVKPLTVAVDSGTGRAFAFDSYISDVAVLDLPAKKATYVSVGALGKQIAIDSNSHVAYLSSGKTLFTIQPDLTITQRTLPGEPRTLLAVPGSLLIAFTSLEKYDTTTWERTAISPPLFDPSLYVALAVDQARGLVFATFTSDSRVQSLRLADLGADGEVELETSSNSSVYDPATSRLYTAESSRTAGARLTIYSVTDRPKPSVERVGGADRYAVSAAISAKTYAPGSPVAYVASGAVFTDALSASAAAGAQGGGVLLVQKNAIPPVIATELSRLKPQQIIVLGGTDTIDPSVETALKAYSATVTRVGGADRYAVSAAVSKGAFGPMRPVAYIASGAVFPDALSGSAGAGRQGGPVLLVTKDGIPDVVQAELTRLAPAKIVVLGGSNTISDSVVTALGATAPTTRIGGADRFAVSAGVSANAFPAETPIAYVASGANFPDALSGGAAAIADGAPVLLVNPDTLPASIDAELDRLLPTRIIILGGTNSVSDAVATAIANH